MEQNFSASDKIDKMLVATLFVFAASSMFSISITQIACGLGGILWLLRTHLTDTWKEQRWPLGISLLFFVVACLIAVANAYDPSYSYKSLKKAFRVPYLFLGIKLRQRKWFEGFPIAGSYSLRNTRRLTRILSSLEKWGDNRESR